MKLGFIKEVDSSEKRITILPTIVRKYISLNAEILIEKGLGESCYISDEEFNKEKATLLDRQEVIQNSDILFNFGKPNPEEISKFKKNSIYISHLDPFFTPKLLDQFTSAHVTAISMEMIPRTTLAQKMDSLSSQASLAGYVMVMMAVNRSQKVLPMMMTPAGTITPAKVLIIGAGVAGLQAIATAKRLGAKVEAFDTRPVVKEQVESLGAKFVEIDLGDTGQTEQGYAKELTKEQLEIQRLGLKKHCAHSDIVITTAQLFGRKAPIILTKDMVEAMKPGAVIVDLAVETGGNVEGSKINEEVEINGVKILGYSKLPTQVALDASLMYAQNLYNMISHFWDKEDNLFKLDLEDEILKSCVLTHDGKKLRDFI